MLYRGLIKFKIFFSKTEYEEELQISLPSLFYSINTDGQKRIKKKTISHFKLRNPQNFAFQSPKVWTLFFNKFLKTQKFSEPF